MYIIALISIRATRNIRWETIQVSQSYVEPALWRVFFTDMKNTPRATPCFMACCTRSDSGLQLGFCPGTRPADGLGPRRRSLALDRDPGPGARSFSR